MKLLWLLPLTLLGILTMPVCAGSLQGGRINQTVGDVWVNEKVGGIHPAASLEVIKVDATVRTGIGARAEIVFADRTLLRLGAETTVRFKPGSREILLDQGTVLLDVPILRGKTQLRTGSLRATVGGATFLMEHLPTNSVKIAVLKGDLRLAVDGFLGDSIVLPPGKLLITKPDVRAIPEPVDVDLQKLVETSSLINPSLFADGTNAPVAGLGHAPTVEKQIARQKKLIEKKNLIPTNLMIDGSGTKIVIPAEPPAAQ